MTKHFSERYYQISQPYRSPSEMKAKGVTVATLHQGCQGQVNVNGSAGPSLVNPYINYPFVPQSVCFLTERSSATLSSFWCCVQNVVGLPGRPAD